MFTAFNSLILCLLMDFVFYKERLGLGGLGSMFTVNMYLIEMMKVLRLIHLLQG